MNNLNRNNDIEFNLYKTHEEIFNYNLSNQVHIIISSKVQYRLDGIIRNILSETYHKYKKKEIQFIVASKRFEFYSDIKYHKYLNKGIITDNEIMNKTLKNLVKIMKKRYNLIRGVKAFEISEYNQWILNANNGKKTLPYIILFLDNFFVDDLELKIEIDNYMLRISQKGRAAGIHIMILIDDNILTKRSKYYEFISRKITI